MAIPAPTTTQDLSCPSDRTQSLLTDAMDLLTCIESTLCTADTDTQIAVACLVEDYLGTDDGDHFPTVLTTITELRDRIYAHLDRPDELTPSPSSYGG